MSKPYVDLRSASAEQVLAYDMEEARNIQQAMVAVEPLKAHPIEFACKFRPVAEVGGDFLDYFWLSDHRLGFYLGDVVGKGLPAALYAALAVGTLRGINKTGEQPPHVLEQLNERLRMRVVPGRYCAAQYAVFDPPTGELWFANAGLPRPLHITGTGCRELGEGGLPSGLFAEAHYDRQSARLGGGEAVLFTTDGLLEAHNAAREEFGAERVGQVCDRHSQESADGILAAVFAALDEFVGSARQHDDITVAVLKLN